MPIILRYKYACYNKIFDKYIKTKQNAVLFKTNLT